MSSSACCGFLFRTPSTTRIHTLSLHDALPISVCSVPTGGRRGTRSGAGRPAASPARSEEHTSELQSRSDLVCRLLLEKKKATYSVSADDRCASPPSPVSGHRSAQLRRLTLSSV